MVSGHIDAKARLCEDEGDVVACHFNGVVLGLGKGRLEGELAAIAKAFSQHSRRFTKGNAAALSMKLYADSSLPMRGEAAGRRTKKVC